MSEPVRVYLMATGNGESGEMEPFLIFFCLSKEKIALAPALSLSAFLQQESKVETEISSIKNI